MTVSKLGGGSYRSAPRTIWGLLCCECILDMLPDASRSSHGYTGGGRWDRHAITRSAQSLFVPATPKEARTAGLLLTDTVRAYPS
jgi:hypothetical protein